jgi:Ca2+-binding RTX toxin-like protein
MVGRPQLGEKSMLPFNPIGRVIVNGTTGDDTFNFSLNQFGGPNLSPYGVEYHSNGGNDNITGTWHNDVFVMNSGHETINGNGGSDTVDYSGSPTGVNVNLNYVDQYGGWAQGDKLYNIQNVTGSSHDDILTAKETGSSIYAGDGKDSIVLGALGNDTVDAGKGDDWISGTLGGTDVVTGGAGKDTFDFAVQGLDFHMTITDFNPLIWSGQQPSESSIMNDPTHDVLKITFLQSSGINTQAQADAAFVQSMGTDGQMHPFAISGHDVVLTIHTPESDGTITLKGAADLIPDDQHTFSILDHVAVVN